MLKNFHSHRANLLSHFISIDPGVTLCTFQSVNRDAAGIREAGDDGWAGDLINSVVAMLSQVYLGVLVYNLAANKQGRCVRAANRKSGIPKLLRITKMMELKTQHVSIFGGIKVV